MKFKQILVPLTGESNAAHAVDMAFQLTRESRAHVIGTDTVSDPGPFLDQTGVGMMAAYYDDLLKTADKVQNQKRANAAAVFEESRKKAGVAKADKPGGAPEASAEWCPGAAYDGASVSALGRLCDLIVVNQPGEKASYAEMQLFESAAFAARRPILVVPSGCAGLGNRAAIAWNGSLEACRAVDGALPLLSGMDGVDIIQIGDIAPGSADSESLSKYLGWHGIAAKIRKCPDQSRATSKIIAAEAKALGATFMVLGAYTHSPLRELILGGVTQSMITAGTLPMVMAH
jgi:nucleotide-binding universal stress UspA family protein